MAGLLAVWLVGLTATGSLFLAVVAAQRLVRLVGEVRAALRRPAVVDGGPAGGPQPAPTPRAA